LRVEGSRFRFRVEGSRFRFRFREINDIPIDVDGDVVSYEEEDACMSYEEEDTSMIFQLTSTVMLSKCAGACAKSLANASSTCNPCAGFRAQGSGFRVEQ
jgi:hypothetical protein